MDHFTKAYDNYLIMGDFNLEPHDKRLGYFLNSNNQVNLVKTDACFKGSSSCTDLILTSRKYSFKNTTSYETGLSDPHHMILTMLKTTFQKQSSRGFLRKRCSENIQQIYRRTPMPKCDFNKVALQLYWNHTSGWVISCKFTAYFQNTFS